MSVDTAPMAQMWGRVAPTWRIYAEYADARAAAVTRSCSTAERSAPATGYSSWPVAPAAPGWRRLTGSVLMARWCSATSHRR